MPTLSRVKVAIVRERRRHIPKTRIAKGNLRIAKLHSLREAAPLEPSFAVATSVCGTAVLRRLSATYSTAVKRRTERTSCVSDATALAIAVGLNGAFIAPVATVPTIASPIMRAAASRDAIAIKEPHWLGRNDHVPRLARRDQISRKSRQRRDAAHRRNLRHNRASSHAARRLQSSRLELFQSVATLAARTTWKFLAPIAFSSV